MKELRALRKEAKDASDASEDAATGVADSSLDGSGSGESAARAPASGTRSARNRDMNERTQFGHNDRLENDLNAWRQTRGRGVRIVVLVLVLLLAYPLALGLTGYLSVGRVGPLPESACK